MAAYIGARDSVANTTPEVLGNVWMAYTLGGYMQAPNLSKYLRLTVQPRCRYRQFCSLPEDTQNAKHRGDTFHWNIYSGVATAGREIGEDETIPKTNFTVAQASVLVGEFSNSVPFTQKLDDLSEHPVREVINQVLKLDCAKVLDGEAHSQFAATPLVVTPTAGTSATDITVETGGTPTATNNVALRLAHVKKIADEMRERDIPSYQHGDYYAVGRPTTFATLRDDLESIQQYTEAGYAMIRNGEKGRVAGIRFVEQTNIASASWSNGKSDQVIFFGDDAVAECVVIPEEIRGRIPDDYGRGRGIAWYYLGGFGITRTAAADARIMEWASAG